MSGRIESIDAVRAVAMVFVVAIHADTLRGVGTAGDVVYFLIDATGRFAVPIFFLSAGYLYATKRERPDVEGYAWTYASRITSLYGKALLLYVPLVLLIAAGGAVRAGADVPAAVLARAWEGLHPAGLLYYGDSVLLALWFLPALAISIVLVYTFVASGRARYLLPVALGLHVVGTFGQGYTMAFELPVQTRDALFFGFFYTSLGYCVRTWEWSPRRDRSRRYLGLAVAFGLANLVERYVLGRALSGEAIPESVYVVDYTLTTPLFAGAVFAYVLSRPTLGEGTPLPALGRYTVVIYLLHPLVLYSMLGVGGVLPGVGELVVPTVGWHVATFVAAYLGTLGLYLLGDRVRASLATRTDSGTGAESPAQAR